MRTVMYAIRHWTDEETGVGECFEVVETEILHVVTGDEISRCGVASFDTRAKAAAFIEACLED